MEERRETDERRMLIDKKENNVSYFKNTKNLAPHYVNNSPNVTVLLYLKRFPTSIKCVCIAYDLRKCPRRYLLGKSLKQGLLKDVI